MGNQWVTVKTVTDCSALTCLATALSASDTSPPDAPPSRREEPKRIRVWVVRRRALVVKPHQAPSPDMCAITLSSSWR